MENYALVLLFGLTLGIFGTIGARAAGGLWAELRRRENTDMRNGVVTVHLVEYPTGREQGTAYVLPKPGEHCAVFIYEFGCRHYISGSYTTEIIESVAES